MSLLLGYYIALIISIKVGASGSSPGIYEHKKGAAFKTQPLYVAVKNCGLCFLHFGVTSTVGEICYRSGNIDCCQCAGDYTEEHCESEAAY